MDRKYIPLFKDVTVEFGTESKVTYKYYEVKIIKDLKETINDPYLYFLYICEGFDNFLVKCPLSEESVTKYYSCTITRTKVDDYF